jgi:hypothetical protein
LRYRRLFCIVFTAIWLAGCGGGGGSGSTPPIPLTASSASQTIGSSGGSVSTTLASQSITVTVPAGAITTSSAVKVTLETPNSLATPFSVARAAAAAKRSTQSVPTGAVPLAAFIVDDGGATLNAPLQVSFTGIAAPAAGQSILISGFNENAFADVSTTTYANGTTSTATNPDYPGITLASPTIYVIYKVPTANIVTPAATIAVAGPASVATGAQGTYAATETTTNGFPFFSRTFTYGVSSGALGTIVATSGVFTAGGAGGLGNITATDTAVSTFTGSLAISVASARPGATGLTEQYAGTLTTVDANNAIAQAPVATTTVANASVTVTDAADAADTSGSTTAITFTAAESDVANLSTVTSNTVSNVLYQPQSNGTVNVRLKKTVATESTGVIYEHDYTATNGLSTILPETTGSFTNDASQTYLETDPGIGVTSAGQQVTTTTNYNADGTYMSTFMDPSSATGQPVADTAQEYADFHGLLALNSIDPGNFALQFAAPANGNITITLVDPNLQLDEAVTSPSWIPSTATTPSTETDTITTGSALDPACTNGSTYPTASKITQTLTVIDAIFGTIETRTTSAYDVPAVGTVCTVANDTINTFYDYTNQEGGAIINIDPSPTASLLTTTVSEALSLQSTNAATVQSTQRSTQSVNALTLPITTISAHVQHIAHMRIQARLQAIRRNAQSLKLNGGLAK